MTKMKKEDILNDADFKDLSGQKNKISIILTILELVIYFGFVALIAYKKGFLSQKLSEGGSATIGIPSGYIAPANSAGYFLPAMSGICVAVNATTWLKGSSL